MNRQIARKKDTGEAGNPGQFGSTARGESEVEFSTEGTQESPRFRDWDHVREGLDIAPLVQRADGLPRGSEDTDIGGAAILLDEDEQGNVGVRAIQDFGAFHLSDPDIRAFLRTQGAEPSPLGEHTWQSERVEVEALDQQGLEEALDKADAHRSFRYTHKGSSLVIGGAEEYGDAAIGTRKKVAEEALGMAREHALNYLREEHFYNTGEEMVDEPEIDPDLARSIAIDERQFLEYHWEDVQEAASSEGLSTEKIANDLAQCRMYGSDVMPEGRSEAFQRLIYASDSERTLSERSPVLNDEGYIIWE